MIGRDKLRNLSGRETKKDWRKREKRKHIVQP